MKILFYSVLFFCVYTGFGQELTCTDFKNGTFYASVDASSEIEYEIIRKGDIQIETLTKIPQELLDSGYPTDPLKINIIWIDDCSYVLTADNSVNEIDEVSKFLNDSGGVLTKLVKIEGNCFHYKSSVNIDGKAITSFGKICKTNEL